MGHKHLPISMENQTSTESSLPRRRGIILFPMSYQGHLNPMLQLANLLHSKGFRITILHTNFNAPNFSNYPHFTFKSVLDNHPQDQLSGLSPSEGVIAFAHKFMFNQQDFADAFLHELKLVLAYSTDEEPPQQQEESYTCCLITDALWHFTQSIADSLNLPRLVFRTTSLFCFLVYASIPLLHDRGYFTVDNTHLEEQVVEFPFLKVKDILKMGIKSKNDPYAELVANMVKQTKASSGTIWNSFKDLEQPEVEMLLRDFPVPSFLIPFPKYFTASSSSLLEQDRTFFPWLDQQPPRSVLYVSFGSLAQMEEKDFLEIAHGLIDSKQPFLWVVRPGLVNGLVNSSTLVESLPDGYSGRVVKWAPQQEVLAHEAIGGFWTHNGWNSTMESVCEGVPMICSPFMGDQPLNARYMSDVSKAGVYLENGWQREEISTSIRRVMVEGEEFRERTRVLKHKVDVSLLEGGSSNESLHSLIGYISSI